MDSGHHAVRIEAIGAGVESLGGDVLEVDRAAPAVPAAQHGHLPRTQRAIAIVENAYLPT